MNAMSATVKMPKGALSTGEYLSEVVRVISHHGHRDVPQFMEAASKANEALKFSIEVSGYVAIVRSLLAEGIKHYINSPYYDEIVANDIGMLVVISHFAKTPKTAETKELSQLPFTDSDVDRAKKIARHLGYGDNCAYTSGSALTGMFCLASHPGQKTGCIVKTTQLGFVFVATLEDLHLENLDERH